MRSVRRSVVDPIVREISFYSEYGVSPDTIDESLNEIKLWKPRDHKFEGKSVTQTDFPPHPIQSARLPQQAPKYAPNPHAFDARTTTADAYQAWPIAAPAQPAQQARAPVSPHKFEGKSVTQEDYPAYDLAPAPPPSRPSYTPNPHAFDARTTTQDAYQPIALPAGVQALGLELIGGRFHMMIPKGAVPPTRATAIVTTTHDYQTETVIKVVAMVDDEPVVLGSFELGGIPPLLLGVPQVHVTYDLDTSRDLRVSAVNRETSSHAELTIRQV